jgi:signal transduction histidine kinase
MSNEELCYYLNIIGKSGRKMDNIIDELLLLASMRKLEDAKRMPLIMADIVAEAQGRLVDAIVERHVAIILPPMWPTALGYAPWVEEVWVYYISNAIKYGGAPPYVELGATPSPDGDTASVRFWVRDNGQGLTPEEQARLFTLFTRLDSVRAKGHGLGLSIVRRIVEKLGGDVGVESDIGVGSTFWFTLPSA